MRRAHYLPLLLAVLLLLLPLAGCAPRLSDEELRETVRPLLERSAQLNRIYFGEGLPAETNEVRIGQYLKALNLTRETAAYLPVAQGLALSSEQEIARATREVYASSYAQHLITLAFYGISPGDDDEIELGLVPVIYARYKTQENVFVSGDRILCVRADASSDAFPLAEAVYDYDSVRYLSGGVLAGTPYIRFSVSVGLTDNGEEVYRMTTEFRIVEENGVWKLDSPTYFSRELFEDEDS